ncbi:MAG TPA: hypothetical protein PKJ16_10595, partial [Spirochaetota bacterium]|nr:hypothetical protein [Spirochaetota bacterium]
MRHKSVIYDTIIENTFLVIGLVCLFFLFLIMFFLFREGIPIFKTVGVFDFILGDSWYPTSEVPRFGVFPLIVASIAVTLLASVIAVPFSLAIAIYLSELARPTVDALVRAGLSQADAERRAALVLLLVTLPGGPPREVLAEALGTERGRVFLGVNESESITWLVKERFAELATATAEREVVLGRGSGALAVREAEDAMRLAEREGYRVD